MLKGGKREKGVIKHFARFTEGFPVGKVRGLEGSTKRFHGGCRERRVAVVVVVGERVLWLRRQSRKERRAEKAQLAG